MLFRLTLPDTIPQRVILTSRGADRVTLNDPLAGEAAAPVKLFPGGAENSHLQTLQGCVEIPLNRSHPQWPRNVALIKGVYGDATLDLINSATMSA